MSEILDLLKKVHVKVPFDLIQKQILFSGWETKYHETRQKRNEVLKSFQAACPHPIILEHKGGYGYAAGGIRACYVCGVGENQPISDPGDEYDFATYGEYKVLTGGQYSYSDKKGREVYQVEQGEVLKARKYAL